VKSLPRGVSLERPSGSVLRRRDRKLPQQETCEYVDEELSAISYRRVNQ
jgi:ribosomal protein L34E